MIALLRGVLLVGLCTLMPFARAQPLSVPEALSKSEIEVETRLPESHPSVFFAFAKRLFEVGRRDDAVMWLWVGRLRFRFHLKASPALALDGDPALMASLNATVGSTINEWANGSPRDLSASIQRALDWDAKSANLITSKEQHGATLAELRSQFSELASEILKSEGAIRASRQAQGLENR